MGTEIYHAPAIHHAMLEDAVRQAAFGRALAAAVTPGASVLDVGAGTGVLSIMAADAGARIVYAVERARVALAARRAVAERGLDGRVHVIHADVSDVRLPARVDVLVSEWLGAFGVDENLLHMVLSARDRWLKPGGRVVPDRVTAWMAPVGEPESTGRLAPPTARDARNARGGRPALVRLRTRGDPIDWARDGLSEEHLLASGQQMWVTDVAHCPSATAALPFRASLSFQVARPGSLWGLAAWFTADCGGGVVLSNAPGGPPTHWGQFVFPLYRVLPLRTGTRVDTEFICMPAGPGYCHHAWSVRVGGGPWQHHDTRPPTYRPRATPGSGHRPSRPGIAGDHGGRGRR